MTLSIDAGMCRGPAVGGRGYRFALMINTSVRNTCPREVPWGQAAGRALRSSQVFCWKHKYRTFVDSSSDH